MVAEAVKATAASATGAVTGVTPGTEAGVLLPGVDTVLDLPAAPTAAGKAGCAGATADAGNFVVPDHFS